MVFHHLKKIILLVSIVGMINPIHAGFFTPMVDWAFPYAVSLKKKLRSLQGSISSALGSYQQIQESMPSITKGVENSVAAGWMLNNGMSSTALRELQQNTAFVDATQTTIGTTLSKIQREAGQLEHEMTRLKSNIPKWLLGTALGAAVVTFVVMKYCQYLKKQHINSYWCHRCRALNEANNILKGQIRSLMTFFRKETNEINNCLGRSADNKKNNRGT